MNNTRPTVTPTLSGSGVAAAEGQFHWREDDDVVLGCECAHPALQIECWGVEEPPPHAEPY